MLTPTTPLAGLGRLPSSITCLVHLRHLELSGTYLTSGTVLLAGLPHLTSLTRLRLAGCHLEELPAGMRLPRLLLLDLSRNQLARLPPDMALPSLQELLLQENCLQELPPGLRLPSLNLGKNALRCVGLSGSAAVQLLT